MCVCFKIAGLVASLVVLLVVVAIGFVFQPLPQVSEPVELLTHSILSGSWASEVELQTLFFLLSLLNKQMC